VKPKVKVVRAEFERVIHAAPRSAPGLFLKPAHRSAPAIFDPPRSVFRSNKYETKQNTTLIPIFQAFSTATTEHLCGRAGKSRELKNGIVYFFETQCSLA